MIRHRSVKPSLLILYAFNPLGAPLYCRGGASGRDPVVFPVFVALSDPF